ncbi:hypothetical protein LTR56_008087 [Elasticomyces elasticus]|nr:hypothetical protein LTR56_008087 [Elasticomyces elasticus]KAK3662839.1 hypothetical protein LTR22_006242 [Elasticomyces elasticus]KAK4930034.1 hypothetical protein LTR49_003362 [Elasticomyces elasticus]KAK5763584.1 hypothetical protein LTS12_006355 [Elasticomyces elasticus]
MAPSYLQARLSSAEFAKKQCASSGGSQQCLCPKDGPDDTRRCVNKSLCALQSNGGLAVEADVLRRDLLDAFADLCHGEREQKTHRLAKLVICTKHQGRSAEIGDKMLAQLYADKRIRMVPDHLFPNLAPETQASTPFVASQPRQTLPAQQAFAAPRAQGERRATVLPSNDGRQTTPTNTRTSYANFLGFMPPSPSPAPQRTVPALDRMVLRGGGMQSSPSPSIASSHTLRNGADTRSLLCDDSPHDLHDAANIIQKLEAENAELRRKVQKVEQEREMWRRAFEKLKKLVYGLADQADEI